MEEELKLKAVTKEEKDNKVIREQNFIPAVLYGKGVKNQNLQVEKIALEKIYKKAKESTLIDLVINDKESVKVLIQDIQKEEVSDEVLHVDFYQVKMDEKITTEINLVFVGTSSAVKELSGTLVKNKDVIEVKCFPNDLIKELEVDISSLKTFDDLIYAKDLKIPEKLELTTDQEIMIAQVAAPRTDEEMKALEEDVKEDVEEVEGVEGKDDEAEEGEEGEEKKEGDSEDKKEEKPEEKKEESKDKKDK